MAQYLRSLASTALTAVSLLPVPAAAQALADPTRPPAALGSSAADSDKPEEPPALQSVLISPQRRVAIINGRSVQVGDKVGQARVARILENEVVLRDGKEVQVLKLFPQVEKKSAAGRGEKASSHGTK